MKVLQYLAICGCCAFAAAEILAQKDPNFVEGRSTIVHLFEWKWVDIASECENFLGPKGYAGVQISPPSENQVVTVAADRPWWERYQPVSYILQTRSGSETELADMIKRCNAVGVRIYVDLLMNDMAAMTGTGTAGSASDPPSKSYPAVPYTTDDFHPTCAITDYGNATNVRNCELVGLPDLDQSKDHVRQVLVAYMNKLIQMGVAGFRVDGAKHMWPVDLAAMYAMTDGLNADHGFSADARAFFFQEVIDMGGEAISKYEYTDFGRVLDFRCSVELGHAFGGFNQIHYLKTWGPGWDLCNGTDGVVFIDNHDNQRGGDSRILTYKLPREYRSATAFMLAHPLYVTRIMSSYDFNEHDQGPPKDSSGNIISPGITADGNCTNGWVCEHRWPGIYKMVEFRTITKGEELTNWWDNGDNQIAFSRGSKGFVAFTIHSDINTSIPTSLAAGTYCDVISGYLVNGACTGKSVVVDASGNAQISLSQNDEDGALAIHIQSKLS